MSNSSYPGPERLRARYCPMALPCLPMRILAARQSSSKGWFAPGHCPTRRTSTDWRTFTSDLLMRGTVKRSFDEIYEAMESVGAGLGFGSGRHSTQFSARGLVEDIDLLFDLMTQSLC